MTIRDMMRENGGNLGWCKPYMADDAKYAAAINAGEIVGMIFDGKDIPAQELDNPDTIKKFAQAVNQSYELYAGYSDTEIIMDSAILHETSCAECPWFGICDAMDGDVEDNEETQA